jgi:hypothetical protein
LSALLFERRTLRPNTLLPWLIFSPDKRLPEMPYAAPLRVTDFLATWPVTVPDQLDRALLLISCLAPTAGDSVPLNTSTAVVDSRSCLAENDQQADYIQKHLQETGLLDVVIQAKGVGRAELTPRGWERVAELTRTRSALTNPVFVARWFGKPKAHEKDAADRAEEMRQLVDDFIFPAIDAAGYKSTKADTDDYNTGIMDKIHFDIRRAPFVVADFTNHNLGVYYEAGMAVGHGIPVIPCCPQSDFKEKHFDIAHVNLIVYDSPAELRDRLERRILGSIGPGPFRRERGETQAR